MMVFAAIASKSGAFADMDKAAIDVAQALARLSELTIFELRGEWRRLHRAPPISPRSSMCWMPMTPLRLRDAAVQHHDLDGAFDA